MDEFKDAVIGVLVIVVTSIIALYFGFKWF